MSKGKKKTNRTKEAFDVNCAFFPSNTDSWDGAGVYCTVAERYFTDKCQRCGWNPEVSERRLKKIMEERKRNVHTSNNACMDGV